MPFATLPPGSIEREFNRFRLVASNVAQLVAVGSTVSATLTAGGTVTANQGTAGAASWPVKASQVGIWKISSTVSAAQSGAWKISSTVSAATTPVSSGTGSTVSVTAAAASTTLRAANTSRLQLSIFNDSTANLFVRTGSPASSTNYTVKMSPADYFELPVRYTGIVTGIWTAANGAARTTEYT